MFAICVKTGIIFKMRNTYFFMYRHRTFTAPVHPFLFDNVSEGDIKDFVFQHNSKFTSAAVNLFIYLFVGTYRLSSHARLEAFNIKPQLSSPKNAS